MILVLKKEDQTDIQNYRPISLLSHLYKLFTKIVNNRLHKKLEFYQSIEQASFRPCFGTNDHLLSLKTIIEKTVEYNRPLVLIFVDFRKAFDTIGCEAILEALTQCRVDYRLTRLIYNIYKNSTACIQLHQVTRKFPLNRNVRQGDTMSPKLFTTVLEYAFKKHDWNDRGTEPPR